MRPLFSLLIDSLILRLVNKGFRLSDNIDWENHQEIRMEIITNIYLAEKHYTDNSKFERYNTHPNDFSRVGLLMDVADW